MTRKVTKVQNINDLKNNLNMNKNIYIPPKRKFRITQDGDECVVNDNDGRTFSERLSKEMKKD